MGFKKIVTPPDTTVQGPGGKVSLKFSSGFAPHINTVLSEKQKIIDSEVLRLCSPYVPHRTGTLERSGILGTTIGSGEVKYIAPYARQQYYNTAPARSYDPRRGGKWFERMKTANKDQILKLLEG